MMTVGQLVQALESLDSNLPVLLAQQDGEDLPLSEVIPIPQRSVVLYYLQENSSVASTKFWIDAEDEDDEVASMFIVCHNFGGDSLRVGPGTYDYLAAEAVVRALYEQVSEFIDAVNTNQHHEFVSHLFDQLGGA